MKWGNRLGVVFASSVMMSVPVTMSIAQGVPSGFMTSYGDEHNIGGHHCPALTWHINRSMRPDKSFGLSGPIWYEDGSGVSYAQGIGEPDGKFTLNVKMMSGDGPTGTITGQRMPDGSSSATAVGPECFAGSYHLVPGQHSREP